jgi:Ni/Fe-hydrogenase 1 B-type cytochrome subunit
MNSSHIQRIPVWSRSLRLIHWSMAFAVIVLIYTGWGMRADPLLAATLLDDHFMAAGLLIPAFMLRLYLLFFGSGSDHISDCESDMNRLRSAIAVLKFYFSLGRSPLPKWYAHNPLWGPLYLLLFVFVLLQITSGLLQQRQDFLVGINLHDLHIIGAYVITTFTLLHIVAVFLHDLGGRGSDISAMINGHRIFIIGDVAASREQPGVPLEKLKNSLKKSHKAPGSQRGE